MFLKWGGGGGGSLKFKLKKGGLMFLSNFYHFFLYKSTRLLFPIKGVSDDPSDGHAFCELKVWIR